MEINEDQSSARIAKAFAEIEEFADPEYDGWTRLLFSPVYYRERYWLRTRFEHAGLTDVHTDHCGNIIGTLPGTEPAKKPIVLGSHTDTVERGGRFDGVLGVLGALEVVRRIKESGRPLIRSLKILDFLGEEANAFGFTCLGSRALSGELTTSHLDRTDMAGRSLYDDLHDFGLDPPQLAYGDTLTSGAWHAYVELHIEQSTSLDNTDTDIGVVSSIAGIKRLTARITGQYDHAGGTRMNERKDALVAAASCTLAIREHTNKTDGYAVATTTHIDSHQASQNIVPGDVTLRAELRSTEPEWYDKLEQELGEELNRIAISQGCSIDCEWLTDSPIVDTDPTMRQHIITAAEQCGLSSMPAPSGATHDAAHIGRLTPMAMIFVKSIDGRSHCPEEYTPHTDIMNGIRTLTETVRQIDN